MNIRKVLSDEKGSVAVYVFAMILCFLTIIGGIFFSNSTLRKNQLRTLLKIKDVYAQQISQADKIAQDRNKSNISSKYVSTDNLLLHFDGINNNGNSHTQNTDTWKNLSKNGANIDGKLCPKMKENENQYSWRENSLHFDGIDDYVTIPWNEKLSPNDYTIELVLNREDIINNNKSIVFAKMPEYSIELNENKKLSYRTILGEPYLETDKELELQKKYHIAITYDSSTRTQKIYINGIMNANKELTQAISHNNANLTIGVGMQDNQINNKFKGNIYAVRMYNKVLSESDIQTNYNIDKERYGI